MIPTITQKGDYKFNWKNWSKISNDAKDIVKGLLTVDPKRRLSAEQALLHPWICYSDTSKLAGRSLENNLNELKSAYAGNGSSKEKEDVSPSTGLLSKIKRGHFYA